MSRIIVPTLNPALLIRQSDDANGFAKFQHIVEGDLQKASRLARTHSTWDERCIWERDSAGRLHWLFPTLDDIAEFVGPLMKYALEGRPTTLVFDVETSGEHQLQSTLLCVGFAYVDLDASAHAGRRIRRVLNVPMTVPGGGAYWAPHDEVVVRMFLAQMLSNPLITKCAHNGGFDTTVMWANGVPVNGWREDTMQLHHVYDAELPQNLGFCGSRYTDNKFWKDDVKGGAGWLDIDALTLRSYCCRDCLVTLDVLDELKPKVIADGLLPVYETEVQLAQVMARATIRGMAVDFERRDSTAIDSKTGKPVGLAPRLKIQMADALSALRQIAGPTFDPGKPAELRWLLFDKLGLPVVKETGTGLASTDKEAVVLLDVAADSAEQRAALKALTNFRQAQKFLSTFVEGLNVLRDGRFHPAWKLLPTTGRMSSSPNCFDAETEVLTLNRGWVRLPDLQENELVAQWHENGVIDFVLPEIIRGVSDAPLVTVTNQHIDLAMTRDHRALLRHRNTGELRVFRAVDYKEDWQQINAGDYTGGPGLPLTDDEIRLLVAIQADGYTNEFVLGRTRFGFTKHRKVVRMCEMLRRMKLPHTVKEKWNLSDRAYRCDFKLAAHPVFGKLKHYLGNEKKFGPWLLQMSRRQIDIFLEEIWHWDGCLSRKSMYSSSTPGNASWVQTLLVLSGCRTNLREYTSKAGNPNWQTDVSRRDYSMTTNVNIGGLGDTGTPVYCVSVPSSYVLVRRNGKTAVTGNCQNWPSAIKRIFRAAPGYKFIGIDLSQAELRLLGYYTNEKTLLDMYAQDINVHTVNAALLFKVKCPPEASDNTNAQTDNYISRAVVEYLSLPQGADVSFPVVPEKKWKSVRTLAKNFEFGCLARGTKVAVLDARGGVPIEQVRHGDMTWCWDGAKYVPTVIKHVWTTGTKPCVKLTLRDGAGKRKTLILTACHKMVLRDGTKQAAGTLVPGARLMPFRRYVTQNGYMEVVESIEAVGAYEVWDLEVEHPAHNFALDGSVFVSNSAYGAEDETVYRVLRSKRDPETNELLFPHITLAEVQATRLVWKRLRPGVIAYWEKINRATQAEHQYRCPISHRVRRFRGGVKRNESINCVDAETEALTRRGWIRGFELRRDDILLTKNINTGLLEWQPMMDLKLFPDYKGRVVEFRSRDFNAVSTLDHRWMVYDRRGKKNVCKTSAEINQDGFDVIHRTGEMSGDGADISLDFIELCGWFLTDGHYADLPRKKTGPRPMVTLIQSEWANPQKVAQIDALLGRLSVRASRAPGNEARRSCTSWSLDAVISKKLHDIFPQRVLTYEFIAALSKKQATKLVETMILGDGTVEASKTRFGCGSRQKAELFQALCVVAGIATALHEVTSLIGKPRVSPKVSNVIVATKPYYHVSLHRRKFSQVTAKQRREYEGAVPVWCPIVPNTFFVARREGQVFITGNTPIQMGVASWMNINTLLIQELFDRETGGAAQIVQQVHDALTVEAPEEYAKRAGEIMQGYLSREFQIRPTGHFYGVIGSHEHARLPADTPAIADHLDKT